MVERFHWQLKASLMGSGWMANLPVVMLGLRTAWKRDLETSPAELVYGEPLRLPGEFLVKSSFTSTTDFLDNIRSLMAAIRPTPSSHHRSPRILSEDPLRLFSKVSVAYVRVDEV